MLAHAAQGCAYHQNSIHLEMGAGEGDGKECEADFRGSFRLMVRVCESVGIIVMERN